MSIANNGHEKSTQRYSLREVAAQVERDLRVALGSVEFEELYAGFDAGPKLFGYDIQKTYQIMASFLVMPKDYTSAGLALIWLARNYTDADILTVTEVIQNITEFEAGFLAKGTTSD